MTGTTLSSSIAVHIAAEGRFERIRSVVFHDAKRLLLSVRFPEEKWRCRRQRCIR
ncbi:hypothetical protein [Azorhizobium oxalatiphilum]|uniref:hypothetical protein n=1 Tax=Azorhizobium oxalatiphilum TaxID=980631 RepID=UPI001664916A|nr:hypothetical protein [Azorhizobium oxalatiphilum]